MAAYYAQLDVTIAPTENKTTYQDRIVRIPGLVVGKPVIKGTRIPVWLVLEYLAEDPNTNTLFEAFPALTTEDVKACLTYAKGFVVEEEELFPAQAPKTHQVHV